MDLPYAFTSHGALLCATVIGLLLARAIKAGRSKRILVATVAAVAITHAAAIGFMEDIGVLSWRWLLSALMEAGIVVVLITNLWARLTHAAQPYSIGWVRDLLRTRNSVLCYGASVSATALASYFAEFSLGKAQLLCGPRGSAMAPYYELGGHVAYRSLLSPLVVLLVLVLCPPPGDEFGRVSRWRNWLMLNSFVQAVAVIVLFASWYEVREALGVDMISDFK